LPGDAYSRERTMRGPHRGRCCSTPAAIRGGRSRREEERELQARRGRRSDDRRGRGAWLKLAVAPHLELAVVVASPWSSDRRRRRRCRAAAKEDAPPLLLPPPEDGAVALNPADVVLDPHPSST
jgi:hypothetical protein